MSSLLVVVFDDEAGARGGADILRGLHAAGTLTLYALAIVAPDPRAAGLVAREPVEEGMGPAAPAVGAAVGALVSLLGGPLALASHTVASGLVGAVRDLDQAGLDAEFLEQVSRGLHAGGAAVVAEIDEERQLPFEAPAIAQGGRVFRHRLAGALPEDQALRRVAALRSEVARLREERAEPEHADAKRAVRQARSRELRRAERRARSLADAIRRESAAKIAVLQAQAARLAGAARTTVERRAAMVQAALEARAARLELTTAGSVRSASATNRSAPSGQDPAGNA